MGRCTSHREQLPTPTSTRCSTTPTLSFWAQELQGERLERDLNEIKRLCDLTTGSKLLDIGCGLADRKPPRAGRIASQRHRRALLDLACDMRR